MNKVVLMLALVLAACGSVKVNYDYDKQTDFNDYRRYGYYPKMESGLTGLDEKRLVRILDSTLQAKGFVKAENPQFYVDIVSGTFRSGQSNTVGVGLGGTNRNVGGGISVGIPIGGSSQKRGIDFRMVDVEKDALFWEGKSESSYSSNATPLDREEKLKAIVAKVFSNFPPGAGN